MSVEVTTLKSGLNVVTDTMPHLETASLGVWVASGSRDERRDEHGISHLLEHMAFKGTRRRSARQIAEEIEAVGGDLNAATSVETTAYYARVLKADVPLALDVLADILSDPAFDPRGARPRAERHRPGDRRSRRHAGRSGLRAFERHRLPGPADRPLDPRHRQDGAVVPDGTLRDYLGRHYRAPDMVVAAAGAVDHAAVVAEVEKRFASFTGPASPLPEPARFGGGSHVEKRDLEQVHIAMALPGVAVTDHSLYSLQVFTNILGGGMSSRLFQEVRERRGLCYSIYSFHMPYSDTGMFGLYAGTDAADTAELMRVVVGEIAGTADSISEPEIARAKAQMKAGLLMALESSGARIEQLARQMITRGRPIPVDELVEKVEAVTVDRRAPPAARSLPAARWRPPCSGWAPALKAQPQSPRL